MIFSKGAKTINEKQVFKKKEKKNRFFFKKKMVLKSLDIHRQKISLATDLIPFTKVAQNGSQT